MGESLLFGKYRRFTKKVFTETEVSNIIFKVHRGENINNISSKFKVSQKVINSIIREFAESVLRRGTPIKELPLGHKNEEYYSEKELIQGIPNYTWEELTDNEKQFYKSYGRKQ